MKKLALVLLLAGCGTDNDVDVNGGTDNRLVIEYRAPMCETAPFYSAKDKLKCLRAITTYKIDGKLEAEGLTPEQTEFLSEVIGAEQ